MGDGGFVVSQDVSESDGRRARGVEMIEKTGGKTPIPIAVIQTSDTEHLLPTNNAKPIIAQEIEGATRSGFTATVSSIEPPISHDIDAVLQEVQGQDIVVVGPGFWIDRVDFDSDEPASPVETEIRALQRASNGHVLVLNGSILDPEDRPYNYHQVPVGAREKLRRVNLAILEASMATGVSVIDVDRIVAEMGGLGHVLALMRYSVDLRRAIVDEIVRVISDIGFFEERPLLAQIGQKREER